MITRSLTATLKYALISDKKMSLIAKLVQGKKVAEALRVLSFTPKKAAKILHKVVTSAANATTNADAVYDSLYIQTINVGT